MARLKSILKRAILFMPRPDFAPCPLPIASTFKPIGSSSFGQCRLNSNDSELLWIGIETANTWSATEENMVALTTHFRQRQSQRGLRRDVLNFILEFGEVTFARKATWLYVRKRALPQQMRNSSLASRAAKWLLMIQEGVLITCYRNDNPIHHLLSSR